MCKLGSPKVIPIAKGLQYKVEKESRTPTISVIINFENTVKIFTLSTLIYKTEKFVCFYIVNTKINH